MAAASPALAQDRQAPDPHAAEGRGGLGRQGDERGRHGRRWMGGVAPVTDVPRPAGEPPGRPAEPTEA
jgi:hypothetical protein